MSIVIDSPFTETVTYSVEANLMGGMAYRMPVVTVAPRDGDADRDVIASTYVMVLSASGAISVEEVPARETVESYGESLAGWGTRILCVVEADVPYTDNEDGYMVHAGPYLPL